MSTRGKHETRENDRRREQTHTSFRSDAACVNSTELNKDTITLKCLVPLLLNTTPCGKTALAVERRLRNLAVTSGW